LLDKLQNLCYASREFEKPKEPQNTSREIHFSHPIANANVQGSVQYIPLAIWFLGIL
jgi:hypothetical protein